MGCAGGGWAAQGSRSGAEQRGVLPQGVPGNPEVEQQLALALSRYGEVVADLAENLQPHKLCTYLFELATTFSSFYENCPVLKSEGAVRDSRLGLVAATRDVLAAGLDLLGITAPERM